MGIVVLCFGQAGLQVGHAFLAATAALSIAGVATNPRSPSASATSARTAAASTARASDTHCDRPADREWRRALRRLFFRQRRLLLHKSAGGHAAERQRIARAILVDTETKVLGSLPGLHAAHATPLPWRYAPENAYCPRSRSGAANSWAFGWVSSCVAISDTVQVCKARSRSMGVTGEAGGRGGARLRSAL